MLPAIQQAAASENLLKYNYRGEYVCQECFCMLHNISRSTINRLSNAHRNGQTFIMHGNKYREANFPVQAEVFTAVKQVVDRDAQFAPNATTRCMPQGIKVCMYVLYYDCY